MKGLVLLRTIAGAGMVETHDCGDGTVGLMELIAGEILDSPPTLSPSPPDPH